MNGRPWTDEDRKLLASMQGASAKEQAEALGRSVMTVTHYRSTLGITSHRHVCARCGAPVPKAERGRPRKYCTDTCTRLAQAEMAKKPPREPKLICTRCGVNPKPLRPDGTRRGWCYKCDVAALNERNRAKAQIRASRRR